MAASTTTEHAGFLIQTQLEHPGGPRLEGVGDSLIRGSERQLKAAAGLAGEAGVALRDVFLELAPNSGTVEFSLTFEGEAGLPVLAKGKAGATLTVTLEWTGNGKQ
jgi:Trypsin-co-occurring domain 1